MSGKKSEELVIDGLRFRVTQMPGRRAWYLSNPVIQLLAPLLPYVAKLDKLDQESMWELLPGVAAALPGFTEEKQERLTNEMFEQVQVIRNGQQEPVLEVFDELFQGRVATCYKLFWAALRVNFASFLPALGSIGTGRKTPTPSTSETSSTSAGPPSA